MSASSGIRSLFATPSAWLIFVATLAATGWLGRESGLGIALACTVSAALAWAVAANANARRRSSEMAAQMRGFREAENCAQDTLDRLPGIVWQCNAAAERVFISSTWPQYTGQPVERAFKKGWAACIHSDDRQRRENAHRIASAKAQPYEIEFRLKAANGGFRTVVDRATPLLDGEGRLLGYVGITIDMTQRKRVESDLRQRVEDLGHDNEALQAQALDLADRVEVQRARLREHERDARLRGEFLAALSDELQGPVQAVHDTAMRLRSLDPDQTQGQQLDHLGRASAELSSLLGRALELSFVAGESDAGGECRCDLRAVAEQAVLTVREKAEERGVVLEAHLAHALPKAVSADGSALRCAIEDLAVSALRIPGKESISLRAAFEEQPSGATAMLISLVLDGRGVTDGTIKRAFYPADAAAGATPGLGLGPCRRRVEQMGGTIGVDREDDGRINLWLKIPMVDLSPSGDPRRAFPRVIQEQVTCSLGPVIDLSVGGMRIRCRKPPEGVIEVELNDEEQTLQLRAEVIWSEKVGFRAYDVGLRFVDIEPQTAAQLGGLAARNRMRLVLGVA